MDRGKVEVLLFVILFCYLGNKELILGFGKEI